MFVKFRGKNVMSRRQLMGIVCLYRIRPRRIHDFFSKKLGRLPWRSRILVTA